jgi:hypothetical protein
MRQTKPGGAVICSRTHATAPRRAQLNEPLPPPDADLSPVAPDAEREIPAGTVRGTLSWH